MILGNAVLCSFPRKHALRIQGIVMDEEEDDFFITQYYFNYIINIIIRLVYYVGVFVLFIRYYKRSALTLWCLEYLRLSVIGIDGCTVGMYQNPLSTFD